MILEARDVRRLYGAFVALDGVSLSVREGEFVSIIGPNGAGKSTLINVLTGVLQPSAGSVRFKGKDIGGIGTVALTRLGMARSFQLVQIFPELTVLETLQAAVISRLGRGARLFASLQVEPVTDVIAKRAGEQLRAYRRSHPGIDVVDYVIAATADVLGADLVTLNVKHFPMFEGLEAAF